MYEVRLQPENLHSNNPNDYWRFLKGLSNKSASSDIDLQKCYQFFSESTHPPDIAYFDLQFIEDIKNIDLNEIDDESNLERILVISMIREIPNSPITENVLMTHLRKLKTRKVPGIDGISAEFLKYAESVLT